MTMKNEEICQKLLKLSKENERVDFLRETFLGYSAELYSFMGYMKAELSSIKIRRDLAVGIMSDIAFIAVAVGREEVLHSRSCNWSAA